MNMDTTTILTTDYDRSKKTEECEIFQPFVLLGAIFPLEIESTISVEKGGFNKKKALLPSSWNKNLKDKLVK